MKQRLSLARTMAHDPRLLILDEPASGLDPRARIELRELLKELRALGKTIVISSHILTELAEMCTHIGIIEAGRLLVSGEVNDVLHSLQPHKVVEVRVLGARERTAELLRGMPGVRSVRSGTADEQDTNELAVTNGATVHEDGVIDDATIGSDDTITTFMLDYAGDERGLSDIVKTLAYADIAVTHFAEQSSDLEDIFMQVTRGVTQ